MPAAAYDALPTARRLEIEREIYQRIFGQPYTERVIPEDASSKQKEYLISCIRNAIYTRNDGSVIKPLQVDVIREMAALGKAEPATAPPNISGKMKEHMQELCAQGKLPHRLEDYFVKAEVNITRNPDGTPRWDKREVFSDQVLPLDATPPGSVPARVNGTECRVMLARATGIPRRQIAEKHLKPLGYKHRGDRSSQGYVAFEKTRPDGSTLESTSISERGEPASSRYSVTWARWDEPVSACNIGASSDRLRSPPAPYSSEPWKTSLLS